ncbi:MAG: hypothetical protein JRD93_20740 [Deltaproteobacteria bacterium]|nr:hypothetical protein [Deltaproteobacteria bacterium]
MGNRFGDPNVSRSIKVNDIPITGDLIGGPYHPFTGNRWNGLAFRADITDLDLVGPGSKTLTVDNVIFDGVSASLGVANGAGLLVIYEDASLPRTEIIIRDGHDFAYHAKDGLLTTTAPQTFKFSESLLDRTANLKMFFSTVVGVVSSGSLVPRPTAIKIDVKNEFDALIPTTTYWLNDALMSIDGQEWDTLEHNVFIPAGTNSLTIQAYSLDNLGTDDDPASLTWIAAALSMPSELCSIGDFVWIDDNKDGIQDPVELGIDNVRVRLYNCSNNKLVDTTKTANGGKYNFTDLLPGDYSLEFIAPDGYDFSLQNVVGADDALDSDANPVTGKTVCTTLEAGEHDPTWDAGLIEEEECGPCKGKITELTLQYIGTIDNATIKVVQKKDSVVIFEDIVQPGGLFTFVGEDKNGTMSTEIIIYVGNVENTKIHTSCSQPIGPGLVSDDFMVIEGYSLEGGLLCPTGEDDDCECDGKVTELTLKYTGDLTDFIEVVQKNGDIIYPSANSVQIDTNGQFTFYGTEKNDEMGKEILIYVNTDLKAKVHTSCSQPIGPYLEIAEGLFVVIEGKSSKGGALCPM